MISHVGSTPVEFTRHALQRLVEMELDADTIRGILASPDRVHPSEKYAGCMNYTRGGYALATRREGSVLIVITALYSTDETLQTAVNEGRLGTGRNADDCTIPRR